MNSGLQKKLDQLKGLYSSLPPTECLETSCADWCCSRLPEAVNKDGSFISLPLIYSIEFLNIREHVEKNFSSKEKKEFYDYESKKTLCCFKDRKSPGCLAYPVRPFTCRVFGRRVPPVFFGMEYPAEAAERVFCANCRSVDSQKEKEFQEKYPQMWSTLAGLSASVSVFSDEQRKIIRRISGMPDIYITGWKEFALLSQAPPDWLEENFAAFWSIHGKLL